MGEGIIVFAETLKTTHFKALNSCLMQSQKCHDLCSVAI